VYDVMHSTFAQQRQLVGHFYAARDFRTLIAISLLLTLPYAWLLKNLLRRVLSALGATALDRLVIGMLFLLPLTLCYFGHDVARWQSDCAIDATMFLLVLAATDDRARVELRAWAHGMRPMLWLGWFLLLGPMDATAIRAAEQLSVLWNGS
jgi:hypothetical protein